MKYKLSKFSDRFFKAVFLLCALCSVLMLLAITIFIVEKGVKPFLPGNANGNYSLFNFLTGDVWKPSQNIFGIGYMAAASALATAGAIALGVPTGLLTAVFIAEIANEKLAGIIRPMIELLSGIPSVLYGVFGYAVVAKIIRSFSPYHVGDSLLAVIIILSIMILPTVVSISEAAIRAVPAAYREAAYGLGATKTEVIFKTVIPAAKSGILAGVVLGTGRAIGETMAVILVAGNPEGGMPGGIFDKVRLITNNIVLEQGYASGMHEEMLFSTGVILFIFIMAVNILLNRLKKRIGET
ncbi:MAG: phosphate ABC transporter permease subunit PstC [Bacillota bacterium]|nr:phosphate ABC transporter permease subunit PstC [Bacillota bacterium]